MATIVPLYVSDLTRQISQAKAGDVIPVAHGGTGAATAAEARITLGAAATTHNHSASNITTGTLAVARGGTGIASYTTGNYIRASAATTLAQRTPAQVLSDIGAASNSISITAGDGLSGGGTLAATRTLTLGTPSTITTSTTNSVTSTSHTHALIITAADINASPVGHTHAIADVTGLQSALDGTAKLAGGNTLTGTQVISNSRLLVKGDTGEAVRILPDSGQTHIQGVTNDQADFAPLRLRGSSVHLTGPVDSDGNISAGATVSGVHLHARGTGGNGGTVYVGDDAMLQDVGTPHTMRLASQTNGNIGRLQFGTGPTIEYANAGRLDLLDGQLVVHGGAVRALGWGGDNTRGVLFLGTGDQYIFGRGNDIEFCSGGRYSTLNSGGTIWTSDIVTPIDANTNPRLGWNCANVTDWNGAINNGWHMGAGASNAPVGGWVMGTVTVHNGDWVTQDVWEFANSTSSPRRWKRHRQAGNWSSWFNIGEIIVSATDPGGMDGTIWVQP